MGDRTKKLERSLRNQIDLNGELVDELEKHKYLSALVGQMAEAWSPRWPVLLDGIQELIRTNDKIVGVKRDYKTGAIRPKGE